MTTQSCYYCGTQFTHDREYHPYMLCEKCGNEESQVTEENDPQIHPDDLKVMDEEQSNFEKEQPRRECALCGSSLSWNGFCSSCDRPE